jgi:single-strand DNA-binding protein
MTENLVILVGRLGKDPEITYTPSGMAIAKFTLATDTRRKGNDGNYTTKTQWHRITAFARTAEVAGEFLTKGKQVHIRGAIDYQQWEDKQGVKKYATDIVVDKLVMMGGGEGNGQPASQTNHDEAIDTALAAVKGNPDGKDDDDLPF